MFIRSIGDMSIPIQTQTHTTISTDITQVSLVRVVAAMSLNLQSFLSKAASQGRPKTPSTPGWLSGIVVMSRPTYLLLRGRRINSQPSNTLEQIIYLHLCRSGEHSLPPRWDR